MPNPFELDGRGPSERALTISCVMFLVVTVIAGAVMFAKSTGSLDERVQITAHLPSVGDGLPPKYPTLLRPVGVDAGEPEPAGEQS